jgi:hypothetical protein
MSNLRLIDETTISSAVSAVNITDVFSDDYDIYKITASGMSTAGSTTYCHLKLINSAGGVLTDSNYDWAFLALKDNTGGGESISQNNGYWSEFFGDADGGAEGSMAANYIFNPFSSTAYTFGLMQTYHSQGGTKRMYKGITVYAQFTSCTGFQINATSLSQDLTGGVVRTYGLRVDT